MDSLSHKWSVYEPIPSLACGYYMRMCFNNISCFLIMFYWKVVRQLQQYTWEDTETQRLFLSNGEIHRPNLIMTTGTLRNHLAVYVWDFTDQLEHLNGMTLIAIILALLFVKLLSTLKISRQVILDCELYI